MPRESRELRKQRLKSALVNKLEQEKKTENYWYDLVYDYLTLWEIKEKLKIEIERNGVMIKVENGQQVFRKRNDAIVELPKISKRMTDILEVLSIKSSDVDNGEDEEY
ncbi:hypothetical protein [Carnobacterium divergens]|uniref:Terminase small subunit n=1 Tax=Carnobacterium divergens TaxID=2748 RepID=A0AAW8R7X2_CARDV|nr:hypothetical protein [Carnobacterium divergens]MDT1957582.1 hypothetical protein [Carnobacterium divergens]MDT1973785.1 hypothetical protein [Carnobacterium divergens]MDT2011128.1 hypothetical protein [Carnobacterium divergens]